MIDFGFDLAARLDHRLWRGTLLSALGAIVEASPLLIAYVALDGVFAGEVTWAWLPWIIGALVASVALTTALKAFGGIDNFTATYGLVCDARLNLADHLRRLPMGFWTQQRTGSVSSVITDEFALYTEIVTHVWSLAVSNLAKPLAIALIIIAVDWRLGLVAIFTIPFALLSIPWSHRLLDHAAARLADTKGRAHARLVEFTQGITTLREYSQVSTFHERLAGVLDELEVRQMKTEVAPAPALFTYKLLVWLGFSAVIAAGAWGVEHGHVAPTRFLLVALLSLQLYASTSELSDHLMMARFASRTLARIRDLFAQPVQPMPARGVAPSSARVSVEQVTFAYEDRAALRDIDAVFEPGTVTALVGPSGSGKSTLAHLLARLWDVDAGHVRIGDVDVREMSSTELSQSVAMVLQDVVLFCETVEDNIRLGRPEAPREEVIAAAKAARAHDFIMALPDGYDTVLSEGGADLSGGQRQRISIARALLLDAPVLILDEATSSVDSHNELLIQQALGELTRGRTVIVIAHRLWTIQRADQILVLDAGQIVERGDHDELLERRGLYSRLWDTQQESRSWAIDG